MAWFNVAGYAGAVQTRTHRHAHTQTHTHTIPSNPTGSKQRRKEKLGRTKENERERERWRQTDRQVDSCSHKHTHTHVVGWNRRVKGGSGKREQTAIRRSSSETRLPSSSRREGSDAMVRSRYMCSCVTPAFPFSATSAKAPCCATPLLKQCTTAS